MCCSFYTVFRKSLLVLRCQLYGGMDFLLQMYSSSRRGNQARTSFGLVPCLLYSSLQLGSYTLFLSSHEVNALYTETIGVALTSMSSIVALSDSVAILISLGIGYASDACNSKYGPRKPFIVVGIMLFVTAAFAQAHPPQMQSTSVEVEDVHLSTNCSVVKSHLIDLLRSNPVRPSTQNGDTESVRAWFAVSTIVLKVGYSIFLTPYNAMGQEFTKDPTHRVFLFTIKGMASFLSILLQLSCGILLAATLTDDYRRQMHIFTVLASCMTLMTLTLTIQTKNVIEGHAVSSPLLFVSTFRSAILRSRVYFHYGSMRTTFVLAYIFPLMNALMFIKFVLRYENAPLAMLQYKLIMLVAAMLQLNYSKLMVARHGFRRMMMVYAIYGTVAYALLFRMVSIVKTMANAKSQLLVLFAIVHSPLKTASIVLLDNYLGAVIDYDEFLHGGRRDGIFVGAESFIHSLVAVITLGVAGNVLGAFNYLGNGGCICGCGSKCEARYLRWDCPGDVGYACTNDLRMENEPFFGDPNRLAPCTHQQSTVTLIIFYMVTAIPSCCLLAACILLYTFPLSREVHREIMVQREERRNCRWVFDPVTMQALPPLLDKHSQSTVLEDTLGSSDMWSLRRSKTVYSWWITFQLKSMFFSLLLAVCLSIPLIVPNSFLSIGILMATLSAGGILWNLLKYQYLRSIQHDLSRYLTNASVFKF